LEQQGTNQALIEEEEKAWWFGVSKRMSEVCLYRGQKVPLGVVLVAPVDGRVKLSIYGIIRITISAFSITEKIGTEGEQELGARPPDLGARPLSGPSMGPLYRARF